MPEEKSYKVTSFAIDKLVLNGLKDYAGRAHVDMKRVIQAAVLKYMREVPAEDFKPSDSI